MKRFHYVLVVVNVTDLQSECAISFHTSEVEANDADDAYRAGYQWARREGFLPAKPGTQANDLVLPLAA